MNSLTTKFFKLVNFAEFINLLNLLNEVDDIDEEQKDRHIFSRRRVVPIPLMRANPETDEHALFSKGSVDKIHKKIIALIL